MEKIKISIEKKQIAEFSIAFIFRHKRKAVAIVESNVDFQKCEKIWKYCLFPTSAGGLYFQAESPETAFLTVKNNLADYCESITGATVVITEKQTKYGQFYNDDELLDFAYKSLIFDNEKKIYRYEEFDYNSKNCLPVVLWQTQAEADTMDECERILPLFKVFIENHINSTLERVEAKIKAFAELYGGKEIKGAMRFSNGECLYNYAN